MKILHYIAKYYTRILLFIVILLAASNSVVKFSQSYENTLDKIKITDSAADIVCEVLTAPQKDDKLSFEAKIKNSNNKSLKGLRFNIVLSNTSHEFFPGDKVKIKEGMLYLPQDKSNEGSFDNLEYQKSKELFGSIYSDSEATLNKEGKKSIIRYAAKLKSKFTHSAHKKLGNKTSAIAIALLTGDKSGISDKDSQSLKQSGVYHIVAISGLHLNIFIMFMSFFISLLKLKRLKKAILSFVLCAFTSLLVLIFTGFGLSVIRAFVMLVISLGSGISGRKYDSKNSLYISAAIILILIPQSFYSVGFRLSVLSTFGVLVSADITKRLKEYSIFKNKYVFHITGVIITSFMCSLFTLPVMIASFGFLPLYSFLGNLFVLPLTTPALAFCLVFALFSFMELNFLSSLASFILSHIIWLILSITSFISAMPLSVVKLYPIYTFYALCFMGVVFCVGYLIIKKKMFLRCVSAVLILSLASGSVLLYNKLNTKAKVIFADVGQGECAIIKLPQNKAVMIDFGTSYNEDYVAEEIKLTLIKHNIANISAVFLSHFHGDHTSGVTTLLNEKMVKDLYVPMHYDKENEESCENLNSILSAALLKPAKLQSLKTGDRIEIGEGIFEILSPDENMDFKANDMSMVIKFTYGKNSFLFTGDIEEAGTDNILKEDTRCNVIKVPHHGGKNNKINLLAQKASADYAVISCGKNNFYGHPHKDTVKAFKKDGAKVFTTFKTGAIEFTLDKNKIKNVRKMR